MRVINYEIANIDIKTSDAQTATQKCPINIRAQIEIVHHLVCLIGRAVYVI